MIIFDDGTFITNSEYPNEDWTGERKPIVVDEDGEIVVDEGSIFIPGTGKAKYVVPDGSELALKIKTLYPNYDFVLDDAGNLIDVVEIEPIITEEQLNTCKSKKIAESKTKLAKWLNNNPILYTDGKYYSVTEEKQALLNGNLASYERAKSVGIEYPLKWNSTGSSCVEWEYSDLLALSLTIAAYVAPKVAIQQNIELDIKACETIDEINAIVIDYDRSDDGSETNS